MIYQLNYFKENIQIKCRYVRYEIIGEIKIRLIYEEMRIYIYGKNASMIQVIKANIDLAICNLNKVVFQK